MILNIGDFLARNVELASIRDNPNPAPDRVVIFPAGVVHLFSLDGDQTMTMDAATAANLIAGFQKRGVKLPIDYEHSTLHQAGQGKESPAAGWITDLTWVPDQGLVASVEWGEKARAQIAAGEYKYLSPHFQVDVDTRRIEHVLAVALTNTPRIDGMKELVAASVVAAFTRTGVRPTEERTMSQLLTRLASALKIEGADAESEDAIVAAVESAVAQADAAPPPDGAAGDGTGDQTGPDPKQVATDTLMMLRDSLVSAGVLGPDASLQDAVDAAIGLVGDSTQSVQESASIRSALGLDPKTKTKDVVAALNTRMANSVPADDVKALKDQVATLTEERDAREVETLVGSLVTAGKLNPNDADRMKWAREQARKDRKAFADLMAGVPALYKSDRQTPYDDAPPNQRDTVIASAIQDHKNERSVAKPRWYVNAALDERGLEHLTDDEAKKHAIA